MVINKQYLVDLCNEILIPMIKGGYPYRIKCSVSSDPRFNAHVETEDGQNFDIIINAGVFSTITGIILSFDDKDVEEEVELLAEKVLGNSDLKDDLYECVIDIAILFVMLHELCHVLRKHLHYVLPDEQQGCALHYSEIGSIRLSPAATELDDFLKSNFLKLAEFDADGHSIILLYAVSLELFAMLSNRYEKRCPNWRTEADNPMHRETAQLIALFGATIALTIIETQPDRSLAYPSPYSRLINLFDGFAQEVFKTHGIMDPNDPNTGMEYLKNDEKLKHIMNNFIFFHFLTALDIANETCRVLGYIRYSVSRDLDYLQDLMSDFIALLKTLTPQDLKTAEAAEYNQLRNYRPNFNTLFKDFLYLPNLPNQQ
jgi:hypothetical protein